MYIYRDIDLYYYYLFNSVYPDGLGTSVFFVYNANCIYLYFTFVFKTAAEVCKVTAGYIIL